MEEEGIDCDFVMTRCCDVLLTDDIYKQMKNGVEMLKEKNLSVMNDVYLAEGPEAEQVKFPLCPPRRHNC